MGNNNNSIQQLRKQWREASARYYRKHRKESLELGQPDTRGYMRTTHMAKSKNAPREMHVLFNKWQSMRRRCGAGIKQDTGNGGLYIGVSVCPEWYKFEPFRNWAISHGFKLGLTLDRIDSNGNYEPSNCQWITLTENVRRSNDERRGARLWLMQKQRFPDGQPVPTVNCLSRLTVKARKRSTSN